jgi:methenyltetrahydromethanopterin cyclohydrolase
MTWNHRIVKTTNEGECYELSEVFYDSEKMPYAYGQASIAGETMDEIKEQLDMFDTAMTKAVLEYPQDFTGDANK